MTFRAIPSNVISIDNELMSSSTKETSKLSMLPIKILLGISLSIIGARFAPSDSKS